MADITKQFMIRVDHVEVVKLIQKSMTSKLKSCGLVYDEIKKLMGLPIVEAVQYDDGGMKISFAFNVEAPLYIYEKVMEGSKNA